MTWLSTFWGEMIGWFFFIVNCLVGILRTSACKGHKDKKSFPGFFPSPPGGHAVPIKCSRCRVSLSSYYSSFLAFFFFLFLFFSVAALIWSSTLASLEASPRKSSLARRALSRDVRAGGLRDTCWKEKKTQDVAKLTFFREGREIVWGGGRSFKKQVYDLNDFIIYLTIGLLLRKSMTSTCAMPVWLLRVT